MRQIDVYWLSLIIILCVFFALISFVLGMAYQQRETILNTSKDTNEKVANIFGILEGAQVDSN